jgi:integrase
MTKYYYSNKLLNQNLTSKPNVVWAADCTSLDCGIYPKINLFLCIDIYSNRIIAHSYSLKTLKSKQIIKALKKAIDKRFYFKPTKKLIIHTDRGTQFSSQSYYNFTKDYSDYFQPSMSRENTPTDNAVAERFMRTFKEHKIDSITIEQRIQSLVLNHSKISFFRAIINQYVNSLNYRPNRKSNIISPQQYDEGSYTASMLMVEPKYYKAFSENFKLDPRASEIRKFQLENKQVVSILEELSARQAEVVNDTPFDDYENNLAFKIIDQRIKELYALILNNPEITREYVQDTIQPILEEIEEVNEGIQEIKQMLIPKRKKHKNVLQLRDPVRKDLYPFFLQNAGNSFTYQKDLKRSQFRTAYTILYHVGLRINEIRHLTEKDLRDAIASHQFNIIDYKTQQSHIHVLSNKAVQDFKNLEIDFKIIFDKYKFKYLFGKHQPIHQSNLIKAINRDLKSICQLANIPYNIKSHSFRINLISNLLKHTTVQNAADIIGHSDICSTLSYKRYALNSQEIKDLLDKIE